MGPEAPDGTDDRALAELAGRHGPVPTLVVAMFSGEVLWANEAARRGLATATAADPVAAVRNAFDLLHPDDVPRLLAAQEAYAEVIATEGGRGGIASAPYRLRSPRGGWITCELTPRFADHGGTLLAVISAVPVEHHVATSRAIGLIAEGAPLVSIVDEALASYGDAGSHRAGGFSWDAHGARAAHARTIPLEMVWSDHPDDPWQEALRTGGPATRRLSELRPELAELALAHGQRSCVAGPIPDSASRRPGCLVLWGRYESQVGVLPYALQAQEAAVLRLALDRHHEHDRLVRAATVDELTGLLNRRTVVERLQHALVRGPLALAFVDLDGFKPVNDRYGHDLGDRVLAVAARRLADAAGPTPTVGRLGGDEFAVVDPVATSPAGADALGRRLVAALEDPIEVPGDGGTVVVRLGTSVGVVWHPGGGSADHLLSAADAAMYAAKRAGGGQVVATEA